MSVHEPVKVANSICGGNAALSFKRKGKGPAFVLVHGFLSGSAVARLRRHT